MVARGVGEAVDAVLVDLEPLRRAELLAGGGFELLEAGEDIDFDGASGPIELGETGSPTAASIGIYEYDAKNQIAPVEYIEGQI